MKKAKPLKTPKKILILRYRFIGDTLLSVPFLRNLRRAYPEAQIDYLAAPNSGELLAHCPYINNLLYFDTTRKHRYENPDNQSKTGSFWDYAKQLKAERYDTAFVLKRSFSSAVLAMASGIPQRVGFDTEWRGMLLTHRVPYIKDRHEIDCFLDVLKAVDIPVPDTKESRHLEYWDDETAELRITAAFAPYQKHNNILIHATSSNRAKEWPIENWVALCRELVNDPEIRLHAVGAASDLDAYRELSEAVGEGRFINWCGKTTLLESMALLKRMTRVIGVDSGTLHMAAAVGVPVTALFGPMDEEKWQPPGSQVVTEPVACRPCNLEIPCAHRFRCMTTLPVAKVLSAGKL